MLDEATESIIDAGEADRQNQGADGHAFEAIGGSLSEQEAIMWVSLIGFGAKQLPRVIFGRIMKDPTSLSKHGIV